MSGIWTLARFLCIFMYVCLYVYHVNIQYLKVEDWFHIHLYYLVTIKMMPSPYK